MSIMVMGMAWYTSGLTPAQKAVLVALADHAHDDGSKVHPSVKRLSIKTSLAERTVRRALADLREANIIIVVKEAKFHNSTEYRIDLSELQARQQRPARDAWQDLPENTKRPARDAPKPSYNHHAKPSEGKEGRKRTPKKRDPLLDHPAIIAYREEARLHVPIKWRKQVTEAVDDADRWQALVHEWIGRGWNKQNIKGLLECYAQGGIKGKRGASSKWDRTKAALQEAWEEADG